MKKLRALIVVTAILFLIAGSVALYSGFWDKDSFIYITLVGGGASILGLLGF